MKDEKGYSLIEVLISLALLGLIGVAFLSGLATATRAVVITDEHQVARNLAEKQMEYVNGQAYATLLLKVFQSVPERQPVTPLEAVVQPIWKAEPPTKYPAVPEVVRGASMVGEEVPTEPSLAGTPLVVVQYDNCPMVSPEEVAN